MSEITNAVDTTINTVDTTTQKNEPVSLSTESVSVTKQASQEVKMLTQDEVNEIIATRLGKEKMRMLKKFGVEDESKIDDIIKRNTEYDTIQKENQELKSKIELNKKTDVLRKLDADDTFIDFILSKVENGESMENFEENAKVFLEANPKLKKESFTSVNSGLNLSGNAAYPDFANMTTQQYLSWRKKNNL
jgi:predicted Fe-Mo cluster-binding NifX family protein